MRTGRAAPVRVGERVVYARGQGLTEWYRSGQRGVEQGFSLGGCPRGRCGRVLTLEIRTDGTLTPRGRSGAIAFTLPRSDRVRLVYGKLFAHDAKGRPLPSSVSLDGHALVLRVVTAGARYPLTIDPLVQQGAKISPPDASPTSAFGGSVALDADGTTALVAGADDHRSFGAVWVFTRSGSVWTEQAKLVPGDEVGGDAQFGASVSLSADGNTALIGGPGDGATGLTGAAWIYTRSGSTWTEAAKLVPVDASGASRFATTVALSADGTTALIGGPSDGAGLGAAWVYTRSGSTWSELQKIVPVDGSGSSGFGTSVALASGSATAVIGGPDDDGRRGAAWVFTRAGSTWTEEQKIPAPADDTATALDPFGSSVAVSADASTILVTASAGLSGAVWAFTASGSTWSEQQKITPSSGVLGFSESAALSPDGNTALVTGEDGVVTFTRSGSVWSQAQTLPQGSVVAVSSGGSTAIVGQPALNGLLWAGEAVAYSSSGSTWSEQQTLSAPSDETPWSGVGASVALSAEGNTAVITGPGDDDTLGAIWVYTRSGAVWSEQQKIVPADANEQLEDFGDGVALSPDGNTILAGGAGDSAGKGAVWVYTRTGSTWSEAQKIPAPADELGEGRFGASIALSADGTTALIAGPTDGTGSTNGAVWVYTDTGSGWSEQQKLSAPADATSDGMFSIGFGSAIAVSADGDTALVAGPRDSNGAGAVWVFTRSGATWSEQEKIVPPADAGGATSLLFGTGLALSGDGDSALIGSDTDNSAHGAVWVYGRSGSSWNETQMIPAPADAIGASGFGAQIVVSPDGGTALIDGPNDDSGASAVWEFDQSGSTWSETQKLTAPGDAIGHGGFGEGIAVASGGATVLVGAPGDNNGSGAAWAFVASSASAPGAPTAVSAVAGNAQATVSFSPPASDGGAPITSYTVTASPGEAKASGSSSPITVSGLTNGTAYTFTVTATNAAGTGPASAASSPVTPAAPSGGGGGGGGSDSISVSISPGSQSVASGGTATFSVAVRNSGGGYLFNVAVGDAAAPNCDQANASTPAATLATLETMAPGVTVSYSCTLAVSSSLTNTVTASGVGPDAVTVSASASASVTVSAAAAPLTPPVPAGVHTGGSAGAGSKGVAVLTLSGLRIVARGKSVSLHLTAKLSAATVLELVLLDGKGHTLTRWVIHARKGTSAFSLVLLAKARAPGHDTLEISESGGTKPVKTLPLLLRA